MKFRYSAISTAYRCLEKYRIEYVLGERPQERNANLEFGTALHLALSSYFETKDPEHAMGNFNMYWNTCKDLEFQRDDWKALQDKAEIFFARFIRLHAKKYNPKYIEHNLDFTVGKYAFNGTPDFVGEYEGVPSIVDFKTSHAKYDKRKLIVGDQLPLYAHAVRQTLDYRAEQLVYVVFVKNPEPSIQVVKQPMNAALRDKTLANIEAMCEDLTSRTKFPMNKESCMYCPHFNRCYEGVISE